MAVSSGKGGYLSVKALTGGTAAIQHVANWSLRLDPKLVDVTTTGPGGTRMAPTVLHPTWSLAVPRDDAAFPELIGLVAGSFVASIGFKLGSSNKADVVENTTVGEVSKENNANGDVVRITIAGSGGDVTQNVPVP